MKHASSPLADAVQWPPLGAAARRAAASLRDRLHELMVLSQTARMQAVLRGMSDQRLAEIGIERVEIARHAEYLVTGKNAD